MERRTEGRAAGGEEKTLGELLRELGGESSRLLRQELELARLELRDGVRQIGSAARQLALGGAVAVVGVLALAAFLIVLLGSVLGNYWLGALIVAVLLLLIGGALIHRGLSNLRGAELKPEETLASLRTTQAWASAEAAELRHALSGDGGPATTGRVAELRSPAPPSRALPAAGESTASLPESARRSPSGGTESTRPPAAAAEGGLLKRVGREFIEDDILGESAKVAYYAFLAFPPALLVLFSLTGYFGGQAAAEWINSRLQGALPQEAAALVQNLVNQIVEGSGAGPFSIGLLLALWAASNVFMSLGNSLNEAYHVEDERSWVKRRALAIGVMLVAVILIGVASVSLIAGPQIAGALNLWGAADLAWTILQWPLAFLFVTAAFFLVYYVLPGRDQSDCKAILFKASMAAAALWILGSFAFRLYIANFASYSEAYGIVGAVIVLLLWLYVTALVVLIGGELASEMERE